MFESPDQENELLKHLKNGDEDAVLKLYRIFRDEFIVWNVKNFNLRDDESADIFQDTVISFYFNIRNNKINDLSSSLKTYLFAIGKNLSLKKIRKEKKMVKLEDMGNIVLKDDFTFPMEGTEKQKQIAGMLKSLGDPCGKILRYYYFDNLSMDSIADKMGYKNQNVVKSQKLRCIRELRERMKKSGITEI